MNTMILKEDPRSMNEQRAASRLTIKPELAAALSPAEAILLAEALDQLALMPLNAAPRWRVQQLEHVLCEKEGAHGLDEP